MKGIILAGGNGTRLWPISSTLMPKQYVKLFYHKKDKRSLFQLTIERNKNFVNNFMIISNIDQYFIALDQLEEIDEKNIPFLLEEIGKNTAPAITFAALECDKDEILFVTPSDHLIKDEKKYAEAIKQAKKLAEEEYLVTFGIKPIELNIRYGYIEADGYNVVNFFEKPDLTKAKKYLKKGNFYWNSGMFMFKAGVFLDELKKHSSQVYEICKKVHKNNIKSINKYQKRITNMKDIEDISIDYALMEKSSKLKIVPSDFNWNDVGSFDSLINEIDSIKAIEIDSKDNFYFSDKQIATIGIENLIVIDTPDALLISKKDKTQKVKDIVNMLKKEKKELTEICTIVHRPWGSYEILKEDNRYKIKRIIVKPGKRLSLQKHFHINEHWIIVSGTATVTVGNDKKIVRPNESIYIKMGEIHRLKNEGKIDVVLIEVQMGEYVSEDDILRIKDDFNFNK